MTTDLIIGDETIKLGERKKIFLKLAKLYDFTDMSIPVEVIRGKEDGPILFVSGAIHGDEINGVEIIRRLLKRKMIKDIKGTLIAVPIVNVFGFNTKSRYLPDRRDLNRSFPGLKEGSLASQIAYTFRKEILEKCTHGIDLHCAAIDRKNLPQIRAHLDNPTVNEMAHAFNVPVILNSNLREGSLRETAKNLNIPIILFEGGEALRFNEQAIKSGLKGIISVMNKIGMTKTTEDKKSKPNDVYTANSSHWVRAPYSGIASTKVKLGMYVEKGQVLGTISDPFGHEKHDVLARATGIIIGMATLPLLNRGEAFFHIATFEDATIVEEQIDLYKEQTNPA